MSSVCQKNFQQPILDVPEDAVIEHPPLLLFGDFLNSAVPKENRVYAEIPDMAKLMIVLKVKTTNIIYISKFQMKILVYLLCVENFHK